MLERGYLSDERGHAAGRNYSEGGHVTHKSQRRPHNKIDQPARSAVNTLIIERDLFIRGHSSASLVNCNHNLLGTGEKYG
jgi:hypothetical protein